MNVTEREKEIIQLASEGNTIKEIGKKLFISPETVTSHKKILMYKLNAKNIAETVAKAIRTGIIILLSVVYANTQCIGLHVQVDNVDSVDVILDKVIDAYRKIGVKMWVETIVPGKEEYLAYSSEDLLLHQFAYGPKYSDINLYLSSRDMGGGTYYKDLLCLHQKWMSDGKPIGRGPFAVIPEIDDIQYAATKIAKKIAFIIGVGELSGPCDGTIMNHPMCADIDNGFGEYADAIKSKVDNAQCLKTTDKVNLSGNLTGYVSGATVNVEDAQIKDMVIAAYEFTAINTIFENVEIIQQTCKYYIP